MTTTPKLRAPVVWPSFVILLVVSTMAARADDWQQWLGPKRDGSTTEQVRTWTDEDAPKKQWSTPVGNGFSTPVIADGRVFIHARGQDKDKEEEEVVALDATTGKVLWTDVYPRPKFASVLGTGPRATPTVAGKRLFTLGINGLLTSYDTESGQRRWQVDLYKYFNADLPEFAVCCSPLVIGNRVILSIGGKGRCVVALHAETGEVQWQSLDDAASTSSPVLFATGQRPRGAAPDVVFMTPLRLIGLDPLDGTIRWEHAMAFQPSGTAPTPVSIGDKMVVSTQAHGALAVQVKQQGNQQDGASAVSAAWQNKEMKSYFSSGVASQGLVLLVTNTVEILPAANLTCLDGESGKPLWSKDKVGYFHAGLIRTGDGKLLILNDSGLLTMLEVDAKGAKEVARSKVCGGTLVSPALAGGRLYVRDDKEVACLQFAQ